MGGEVVILCARADRELALRLKSELGVFPDLGVRVSVARGREPADVFRLLATKEFGRRTILAALWSERARESEPFLETINAAIGDRRPVVACLVGGESRELLRQAMPERLRLLTHLDLGRDEDHFELTALAELARLSRVVQDRGDVEATVKRRGSLKSVPLAAWGILLPIISSFLLTYFVDATTAPSEAGWTFALRSLVTPSGLIRAGAALCYVGLLMATVRHLFEFNAAWLIAKRVKNPEARISVSTLPMKFVTASAFVVTLFSFLIYGGLFFSQHAGGMLGPDRGSGRLAGRLLDISGRPLGGVLVAVFNGPGAQTDGDGHFLLEEVPTGFRQVAIEAPSGAVLKTPKVYINAGRPATGFNIIYAMGKPELGIFSMTEPDDGEEVFVSEGGVLIQVSGDLSGLFEILDEFEVSVLARSVTSGESWVRLTAADKKWPPADESGIGLHEDWGTFVWLGGAGATPVGEWEFIAVAARKDSGIAGLSRARTLDELPPHISSNIVRVKIVSSRSEPPSRRGR
jgi:hypothetical protein